jgi:aqualysin 1
MARLIRCTRAAGVVSTTITAFVLSLFAVTLLSGQSRASHDVIRHRQRPVVGRYIVALRSNDDPDAAALMAAGLRRGRIRHIYRHGFRGFALETSEAEARRLASDPGVAYVEEDSAVRVSGLQSLDETDNWGLDRIDQREIWKDARPAYDHRYQYAADGSGVNVYVIDTGIRTTHEEFGGRAFPAFDARAYENVEGDCHGHGTHIAGIVGGTRFGVAKWATLRSVRVIGCDGVGYLSDLVAGIDWVTANHIKPAVVNMSIQGSLDDVVTEAMRGAVAAGITVVGAAGNDGGDGCLGLMGGVPAAISVAATDSSDRRESYSNYGACVDMFAPGAAITSAYGSSDTATATLSGTSMASPYVAGAAALYLQHTPDALPAEVGTAIVAGATIGAIQDPGIGSPNRILFTPYLGDTTPPVLSDIAPSEGATIHGTRTVSVSAEDDGEIAKVVFSACGAEIGTDSLAPYSVVWDSTVSPEGPCVLDVQAIDLIGNVSRARVSIVVSNRRDEMPPHIELTAARTLVWRRHGVAVPVTFTGSVSDNAGTMKAVSFTVTDEYGSVQPSGVASVATDGRFRITIELEARRRGQDFDGRRYVMSVTATDLAGNSATAVADVVVEHDRR